MTVDTQGKQYTQAIRKMNPITKHHTILISHNFQIKSKRITCRQQMEQTNVLRKKYN